MTNIMHKTTNNADQALIALLRENARMPIVELARRLGVSRTTAQSRLERLERRGIIRGYGVRLSPGYERELIKAHILVRALPKNTATVEAELRRMPAVRTLHSVSGDFDMIAIVESPSIGDLDAVIDNIGMLDGVERTASSIILSTRIDR